jgi:hypothetical protein
MGNVGFAMLMDVTRSGFRRDSEMDAEILRL